VSWKLISSSAVAVAVAAATAVSSSCSFCVCGAAEIRSVEWKSRICCCIVWRLKEEGDPV